MKKGSRKSLVVKSFSIIITLFVLGLLVLSGPAQAFTIGLIILEDVIVKGETTSFTGEIEINSDENLPVDNLILKLDGDLSGGEIVNCLFSPNGTEISGCKGLLIDYLGNASFEYGNGYGYYGYGYNFGYGYGFTNGKLMYNFTLNTTDYALGNYTTKLTANIGSNSFSNTGDNIIIGELVNITNLLVIPSCSYETDNITVSADITGSIQEVWVETNISGVIANHSTINTAETYSAIINGIGGQNISWRFVVEDIFGGTTYSDWNSQYIVRRTSLSVNPISPNGLNGWYTVEPIWTLENPDANVLYYKWNGDPRIEYTGPFGLENIPNPDKQSAGTMKLNYFSNTTCGLEEFTKEIFYVDLKDPEINDLTPANNSQVNGLKPPISAYLDEVYQSNSGIDDSTIVMKLDGVDITSSVVVTDFGLDRRIVYNPPANLALGWHEVYVYARDNSGRESETSWRFNINITSIINLTVHSPIDTIYDTRRIPFNITSDMEVEKIEYINWNKNNPKARRLCRDCDEYGFDRKKTKILNENDNNITIIATDEFGFTHEKDILFFVDSKKPRISRTYPRRNKIVNGSGFYIKFKEDNLNAISITIESYNGTVNIPLDINACNLSRRYYECYYDIDLTGYDKKWVDYYFTVEDSINKVDSRTTRVKVDTTKPELTIYSPETLVNDTYGRRVPFNITITEDVLLEYYDYNANNPKWRRLTSNRDEYGFTRKKTRSFKRGNQTIDIRATDKAGNFDIEQINFEVDY